MEKNILFVCKYNRFRSRTAESLFKKHNKGKSVSVKSAGIIVGSPIDRHEVRVAKSMGINILGEPQGLSTRLLKWQDVIVNVADDVPDEIFRDQKKYGKRLISWKVPDVSVGSDEEIKGIISGIDKKVRKLVEELNV